MREPLRSFFDRRMNLSAAGNGEPESSASVAPGADARGRLHLAACALLLELAHADDEFSDIERSHIEAVLRRHFDLDADTARELMELADVERRSSDDVYAFAALIRANYDLGQKTLLAEVMWGLILADGKIARHEAHLLRKIAGLLDLEPGYLAEARKGRGQDGS